MTEIKNAVITSTEIEIEDHGILTLWLNLDYGGSVQGFGGYSLDNHAFCAVFIRRCLEVVGVHKWSEMRGKTIRVALDKPYGLIQGIGNIIKDEWFYPRETAEKMTGEAA